MLVIGGKSSGLGRRSAGKVVTWAGSVEKVVDFVRDVAFMTPKPPRPKSQPNAISERSINY